MKILNQPIDPLPAVFLAVSLLATAFAPTTVYAETDARSADAHAALYPAVTQYDITRNGKNVGTHTLTFNQTSDRLTVDVESNIVVTVLKVPVFRFNYTANEVWKEDQLISLTARTNRAGDITTASLSDEAAVSVEHASNHWNPDVLNAKVVFNTLTGNLSQVMIESLGAETLEANGESVISAHYRYSGDIQADVWYDSEQRWIKLQFKGDDGSNIVYTANPLTLKP